MTPDDGELHRGPIAIGDQEDLRAMLGLNSREMSQGLTWDGRAGILKFLDGRI